MNKESSPPTESMGQQTSFGKCMLLFASAHLIPSSHSSLWSLCGQMGTPPGPQGRSDLLKSLLGGALGITVADLFVF